MRTDPVAGSNPVVRSKNLLLCCDGTLIPSAVASIYWWSEGTLQSAIMLNGHESDGGRDDRTT